jgi:hypothetical protein
MSDARHIHGFVLLVAAALALAGCSSTVDMVPEKLGGLPSGAPQRPATTLPTPNVYEVRPTREAKPLSDAEQQKLESDLLALRETEKQRANPPPPPPPEKKGSHQAAGGSQQGPCQPRQGRRQGAGRREKARRTDEACQLIRTFHRPFRPIP